MPLQDEPDAVARKPRKRGGGPADEVWGNLPDSFFTKMKSKAHRSVLADYRWAHDNLVEYRAYLAKWDGKSDGKRWEKIYELLCGAPGMGAITLIHAMLADDDKAATLKEVMKQLAKGDDEEEDVKRQRDAKTRFSVISRLLDVGRPTPPWLDRDWKLEN